LLLHEGKPAIGLIAQFFQPITLKGYESLDPFSLKMLLEKMGAEQKRHIEGGTHSWVVFFFLFLCWALCGWRFVLL